jgi:uncharacterized membrane protein YdjX (TVP38/TMEM64 family)
LTRVLSSSPQDLEDLISRSGYLGPLIFIGAYAGATVLLFPASLLTLGAGYLFGAESQLHGAASKTIDLMSLS